MRHGSRGKEEANGYHWEANIQLRPRRQDKKPAALLDGQKRKAERCK